MSGKRISFFVLAAALLIAYHSFRDDPERNLPGSEEGRGESVEGKAAREGSTADAGSMPRRPVLPGTGGDKRRGPVPKVDDTPQLIQEALRSREPGRRVRAVSELAWAKPSPEVVTTCLRLLSDRSEEVRVQAVLALRDLEDGEALDPLQSLAQTDPSPAVRAVAANAVKFLGEILG